MPLRAYLTTDFGVYLGEVEGKWWVGIKTPMGGGLSGTEAFDTLDELKQEWRLD